MKPGSKEFRKYMQKNYPKQPFEKVAPWLARLNKKFGFSSKTRLQHLYYDNRLNNARFTIEEYQKIFGKAHL